MTHTATLPQARSTSRIASLHACVPPDVGEVQIMYDATLSRPLRMRDSEGNKLAPGTHAETLAYLEGIDALLHPLSIEYLRARLYAGAHGARALDGTRLSQLPRVLFAFAADIEALQDVELHLRAGIRVPPGEESDRHVETTLDVHAGESALTDREVRAAVQAYGEWATRIWARAVMSTLGPWLLDGGVAELRLAGSIRPDRRRQLEVLSGGCAGTAR